MINAKQGDVKKMFSALNPFVEAVEYELMWNSQNSSLKKIQHRQYANLLDLDNCKKKIEILLEQLKGNVAISTEHELFFPEELKKNGIRHFYYKGDLGIIEAEKKISIVGARKSTLEGEARARKLAKELSKRNFVIVSGLAKGIDTAAMTETIKHKGRLIGVIGTPITEYYPKENKALQDWVAQNHLLVSHVPFYKYSQQPFSTKKFYFPERNVIMAAISDATIIVEASDTSGTLTQAKACMEMGKKLFILDSCFNKGLKWPSTFQERGAIKVKNMDELLEYLHVEES